MQRVIDGGMAVAKAMAAVSLTIRRGEVSISVNAIPGESQWESEDVESGDVDSQWRTRDWIIAAADYDFGEGPVEPATSDRYEVIGPTGSVETWRQITQDPEQPWRYTDRYRQHLRIHTVRTTERAA